MKLIPPTTTSASPRTQQRSWPPPPGPTIFCSAGPALIDLGPQHLYACAPGRVSHPPNTITIPAFLVHALIYSESPRRPTANRTARGDLHSISRRGMIHPSCLFSGQQAALFRPWIPSISPLRLPFCHRRPLATVRAAPPRRREARRPGHNAPQFSREETERFARLRREMML